VAFNLNKLARAAEFKFELGSVGIIRCKSLTSDLMRQFMQRINAQDSDSKELARWLLGEMAICPANIDFKESDPIEGASLTPEQLSTVTIDELESFAERVVQKNRYLVKAHEGEELQRGEGQSACDFLAQAIEHSGREKKARIDRIIESASKPMFAESTLDSMKKSISASTQFEDLIKRYSIGASSIERSLVEARVEPRTFNLSPIDFPKNPIFETNQILENLTDQIEGMRPLVAQGAEMIRSMNDTALLMQADYISNADRSDRHMKKAMTVAVFSLVVSAVGLIASSWFSYRTYADGKVAAKESRDQGKAFENLHKDLMTAQHDDRLLLTKALADLKQPVPVGKR